VTRQNCCLVAQSYEVVLLELVPGDVFLQEHHTLSYSCKCLVGDWVRTAFGTSQRWSCKIRFVTIRPGLGTIYLGVGAARSVSSHANRVPTLKMSSGGLNIIVLVNGP
jgi:hypothetical protein